MSTGNTGATGDLTNIYGYLQGPKGDPGKDADPVSYQVVGVMVQEQLLQNPDLIGPTGATGPIGFTGPQGIQGIRGDTGPLGPIGYQGV